MKRGPAFDVLSCPLTGVNLVEANAGTGKTYNIARLYLRLVLEGGFRIDEIVAVTYTRAATAELRHRIHSVLLEAARVAAGGPSRDKQEKLIPELLHRCQDPSLAVQRLRNALLRFDEVSIETLHGFCGKALSGFPVESGAPGHSRFLDEVAQTEFRNSVFRDFSRRVYGLVPMTWLGFLEAFRDPAEQVKLLQPQITHPRLLLAPVPGNDITLLMDELRRDFSAIHSLWSHQRPAVSTFIRDCVAKGKAVFKDPAREAFLDCIEGALSGRSAGFPDSHRELFYIEISRRLLKGRTLPDSLTFFREFEAFAGRMRAAVPRFKTEAIAYFRGEAPRRKASEGIRTYDDLIVDLHEATGRNDLTQALRKKYRAALIDEFQDTDPRQFEIFSRIFSGESRVLYLIGDPKQSIYSFRGADIFNYRDTCRDVLQGAPLSLHRNFRSHSRLISAVNCLFKPRTSTGAPLPPFFSPDLGYSPSSPSGLSPAEIAAEDARRALVCGGENLSGMTLWLAAEAAPDGTPDPACLEETWNKTAAYARIADAVAATVLKLLEGGATLGQRPLELGDFAVLIRSAWEARYIKEAFDRLGVTYVHYGQNNVLTAPEADQIGILLPALLSPESVGKIRAALATDFCGFHLDDLLSETDSTRLEAEAGFFNECHRVWRQSGLMACARRLFSRYHVIERLLARFQGERSLTNFLHLFELLDERSQQLRHQPERLVLWFLEERKGGASGSLPPDRIQLRLERDAPAVRIMTPFRAKGLEFPVVFCPYPWTEFGIEKETALCYHEPDQDGKTRLVYDLTLEGDAVRRRSAEKIEEQLRMLYVAFTRASSACYFSWGRINETETSALGYLLHCRGAGAPESSQGDIRTHILNLPPERFVDAMRERLNEGDGAIRLTSLPAVPAKVDPDRFRQPIPKLSHRVFSRTLRDDWRIGSYSGLAQSRAEESPQAGPGDDERDEGPESSAPAALPATRTPEAIFTLPKGARTGDCLHAILEKTDFASYSAAASMPFIQKALAPLQPTADMESAVAEMVGRVVDHPMPGAFGAVKLRGVRSADRLSEVEFLFPVSALSPARLRSAFGNPGLRDWQRPFAERLSGLRFHPFQGHLRGFMDLVFRHDGRYYLLDWKSNHLGNSPADYDPAALRSAMVESDYVLQYHLYAVALDRFLKTRVAGYDYDRHFGGVFYVFLRGVHPDHPGCGIFYDLPDPGLIRSIGEGMDHGQP